MERPAETIPEKKKALDQRQGRQLTVTEKLKQLRTSVNDFIIFVPTILTYFEQACEKFKAGGQQLLVTKNFFQMYRE